MQSWYFWKSKRHHTRPHTQLVQCIFIGSFLIRSSCLKITTKILFFPFFTSILLVEDCTTKNIFLKISRTIYVQKMNNSTLQSGLVTREIGPPTFSIILFSIAVCLHVAVQWCIYKARLHNNNNYYLIRAVSLADSICILFTILFCVLSITKVVLHCVKDYRPC